MLQYVDMQQEIVGAEVDCLMFVGHAKQIYFSVLWRQAHIQRVLLQVVTYFKRGVLKASDTITILIFLSAERRFRVGKYFVSSVLRCS